MSVRPFQCPNCRNWYTQIPVRDGEACVRCIEGSHSPHHRTGIVDCHFGHITATDSEIRMAQLLQGVENARDGASAAVNGLPRATDRAEVTQLLVTAERAFADAEQGYGRMPDILRWAGVFEMPGMTGEPASARFKSMEAIEELVGNNRRPPSDLDGLRRSVRLCNEMASEVTDAMAEARVAMGQLRQASGEWKASGTRPAPSDESKDGQTVDTDARRQRMADLARRSAAARKAKKQAAPA